VTKRRWGLEPDEWSGATQRLLCLLRDAATRRETVTYGDAARHAFDGRFSARSGALMDLLGDVDTRVMAERGVMIATLVVRADTGRPGEGYFAFAADEMGRDVSDRERFWRKEAEAVWEAYAEGNVAE